MTIGVLKEIKADEQRVAITPAGVSAFLAHGHRVLVERGAGRGSGIPDEAYAAAGAEVLPRAEDVWHRADMIMKVKEPLESEYSMLRPDQILFTYLHLAASEQLTRTLVAKKVIAFGYETIQRDDGSLPLLVPMSEVAGTLAVQKGAYCLEATTGGSGILLSGVSGVKPANVVILGAGVVGTNACMVAAGIGAHVTVLDIDPARLRYVRDVMQGRVTTVMSNTANIEEEILSADLVICAVLIPGGRAPKLISRDLVERMKPGSAIVDIAIDQGGCCETSRPTTHHDPVYVTDDVVHYCVTNMPGAVPRTSTYALTNVTLSYGLELANLGYETAIQHNPSLKRGLNVCRARITHKAVADAFGMDYSEP